MKKKYLLIGQENTILSLNKLFKNTDEIECKQIEQLIDIEAMWWLKNADAYFISGTWGSKNNFRQYSPFKKPLIVSKEEVEPHKLENRIKNVDGKIYYDSIFAHRDFLNSFYINLAKQYNIPVIVIESPTLSRIKLNHLNGWYKETLPRYYRMGLNHWTYGKSKWCKPKSDDKLKELISLTKHHLNIDLDNIYNFKWKNNKDGDVLIVPGLETDPTSSLKVEDFIKNTYFKIKEYTNKKILIKAHPKSNIDIKKLLNDKAIVIDSNTQLYQLKSRLYCAIIDNSTSIFQLINLGIPVITSKDSFGHLLKNTEINKINDLHYATQKEVFEWYKKMSYTEFLISDFSDIKIINYIQELLND